MRIYFMGICGTAMGNAALLARAAGHEVFGADSGVYPPMSEVLASAGVAVETGYDAARLERRDPDLVVIGNAQSRGNPEIEWLLDSLAIPFDSLPGFLSNHVLKGRKNLVIAGTHGKTTTTAIAAFLLIESGCDPGYLIGGVPQDPPAGSHLGSPSDPFVIEGDEYDSAFFDKRSKFIHYAPRVAVLNNLEFDHADIFRDLADVQRSFTHFRRLVPRSGCIVANGDDPNIAALEPTPWTRTIRVGTGGENDVRVVAFKEDRDGSEFELLRSGALWFRVRWSLPGLYNARNAAMAAVACDVMKRSRIRENSVRILTNSATELDLSRLSRFRPVRRRQEIRARTATLTVIEDFGHHPTAIAETLRSFRSRFPGAALVAVFEPRSNTARTRALQDEFSRALALADSIYLGAVNRPDLLKDAERFDADTVASDLAGQGRTAGSFASNSRLLEKLTADTLVKTDSPRAVVFFSNGSFDGIIDRYVAAVGANSPSLRP